MEGWNPPPPPPQCYNEIKNRSAYRVNGKIHFLSEVESQVSVDDDQ